MLGIQPEAGDQQPVLSFHDSLLRASDLATLSAGNWLNDQIISFYLQYLEYNAYKKMKDDAAFLAAEVVQLMKTLSSEDLQESFGYLAEKKIVFIPLNNCEVTRGGGSHWSLIIYFDGRFYHLDSSHPMNEANAEDFCKKISKCISKADIPLETLRCPSQTNHSDCGVYVLEFTEAACAAYTEQGAFSADSFNNVTPNSVSRRRSTIRNIIQELQENPEYSHL